MKTIYEYDLEVTDTQEVVLPVGSKILTVQVQNGVPCLWATVDVEKPNTDKKVIRTFGTGQEINANNLKYINTYQLYGGEVVFHVFMEK